MIDRHPVTKVYVIDVDDVQPADPRFRSWLASDERDRLAHFATADLARRFAASRLALRIVLGSFAARHPAELVFVSNAWGRPELPSGPHFNLTHAAGSALVAVDEDAAVGIDAEAATEAIDEATMAEFLSPEEASSWQAGECSSTRLWVRKEALLKASGRGLSIDPKTLTVGWHPADTGNWRSIMLGESREPYRLIDIDAGGMVAALARFGSGSSDILVAPFQWPE